MVGRLDWGEHRRDARIEGAEASHPLIAGAGPDHRVEPIPKLGPPGLVELVGEARVGQTVPIGGSAGQSQMILRFLFGAIAEAWEMVKNGPFIRSS